jgi:hypothetical protein
MKTPLAIFSIHRQNVEVKNADGKNIDGQYVKWDKWPTGKMLIGKNIERKKCQIVNNDERT